MSGNGVDLGAIYGAILALDRKLTSLDQKVDRGLADLRQDFGDLRHDVAGLRDQVADYHGSVVGHGIIIGEHEERIARLERGPSSPKAA